MYCYLAFVMHGARDMAVAFPVRRAAEGGGAGRPPLRPLPTSTLANPNARAATRPGSAAPGLGGPRPRPSLPRSGVTAAAARLLWCRPTHWHAAHAPTHPPGVTQALRPSLAELQPMYKAIHSLVGTRSKGGDSCLSGGGVLEVLTHGWSPPEVGLHMQRVAGERAPPRRLRPPM